MKDMKQLIEIANSYLNETPIVETITEEQQIITEDKRYMYLKNVLLILIDNLESYLEINGNEDYKNGVHDSYLKISKKLKEIVETVENDIELQ